jgi:glycerol uptake facilitator-like aquaporin
MALRGELAAKTTIIYLGAQALGGILGVLAAHLMFELPLWQVSVTARAGSGQLLAGAVATFSLLLTILGCAARTPSAFPYAAGLFISAAYWLTCSTSFANSAVTIARSLSDTSPALHLLESLFSFVPSWSECWSQSPLHAGFGVSMSH